MEGAETAQRKRRPRRSGQEVEDRIRDAARQVFAERGYAAATTKEIARVADASETLLFRYFGDKRGVFKAAVAAPFNAMMEDFTAQYVGVPTPGASKAELGALVGQLFHLLEDNRQLLAALITNPAANELLTDRAGSFDGFFQAAAIRLGRDFIAVGRTPPFDFDVLVRLSFGMIASGVLLKDWLFPNDPPSSEKICEIVTHIMINGSLVAETD